MSTSHDVTTIICRALTHATASWSGTFRLALVLFTAGLGPMAVIVLISIIR